MEEKMSRWGIGPAFAALSIGYGMMILTISRYFDPLFGIGLVPCWFLSMLGAVLILLGVPFLIASAIAVMRAYHADELVTGGVFRCCRHPLYASWVVFIVPGMVFLANSWTGLTTPIFMYFILRILARKEGTPLENVFGTEYLEYKNKVPCILPVGCLKPFV